MDAKLPSNKPAMENIMSSTELLPGTDPVPTLKNILLADDDPDDCDLFRIAIRELKIEATLTTVYDGVQLMNLLKEYGTLPCVLFLDQNMPKKNGTACLKEIKSDEKLSKLPVYILSTSSDKDTIKKLYLGGARHYIKKPNGFSDLKKLVLHALKLTVQDQDCTGGIKELQSEENFVLSNTVS